MSDRRADVFGPDAAVSPRGRENRPWVNPRVIAGSLYAASMVAIAAVAAWPIYVSVNYLVLVAVAVLLAAAIAGVSRRLRWSGWITSAVLVATFFVVGVPLAVPSRLGGVADVFRGMGELAAGVFFAWKDLVTVELPVGSYRNLLVPALVVFLVGTCGLLLLAWRRSRVAYVAVVVGIAMCAFGLFFGRTSVSAPLSIGPVTLYAPLETALGAGALVSSLAWLAWRTHDERVRALQRAAVTSGVRVSRRPSRSDQRRVALGAGMVAAAVAIAVAVVPFAARGADRDVLRSAVGPDIDLSAAESPLSQYRALFDDQRAEQVMFTVATSGTAPSRIRIATLDAYDGEVFRSGGDGSEESGRFLRVPSTLDVGEGEPVQAEITIGQLPDIWMPTVDGLERVDFAGARAATLADHFYYSQTASAGVQTVPGGFAEGDTYTVSAVQPQVPELAEISAPGGAVGDVAIPDSVSEWVEEHAQGSGGEALEGLVALLRERGYLSHGLNASGDEQPTWAQTLGDYTVQPSASGHSLARIDALFQRLLERENDPRAEESDNYVAAIGDDEQFAVATALIARELGFPSRVVWGARMDAEPGVAVCEAGVCEAQDLVVWTEVASDSGMWVPIDVTPQYENSPSLDITELRDPKNVTEVRPDTAEKVLPPDPLQQDTAVDDADAGDDGVDLAWLWPVIRIALIVLLLLLLAFGPFLVVIAAKAARRRSRRRAPSPAERIAGAWDEYVDVAVDAGRGAPGVLTRRELAAAFDTPQGESLAIAADRAVFSGASATDAEASEAWDILAVERRALRDGLGVGKRFVATVSLRSFVRQLSPARAPRSRLVEKGRRGQVARSTL
ncbi:transglutaminase-like domain-containing protein [Microbacterium sp. C7(2022)]|uniref:transglutaminase-like domain-containing protein n=1 Tax=Microbacterium sp. C7(2022) TaxID=2992759 RepID=UPI00237B7152|nr:transglutaminase-like domain-containing protein [Microbacterium sp. C7(2022)]MDE0545308.1 transglutaminase-like domain-containing protein [Microbacterium sp. C7(2022)]